MAIVFQKPSYWVTVRDNFWDFLIAENGAARMYEPDVYRSPVVKSIGLTGTVAEGNIYASGIVYDYTRNFIYSLHITQFETVLKDTKICALFI